MKLPTNREEWLEYVGNYRITCPVCYHEAIPDFCDWDCCQCTEPYAISCVYCNYDSMTAKSIIPLDENSTAQINHSME